MFADNSYALAAVGFAAYGMASYLVIIPRQDQLISIAPQVATVSLSWFSTTNYVGIALVPLIGAQLVPSGGSALTLVEQRSHAWPSRSSLWDCRCNGGQLASRQWS